MANPIDLSIAPEERTARRFREIEEANGYAVRARKAGGAGSGATGAPGINGATWYSGPGVPEVGLGANNDFYLRISNDDVYKKSGGTWTIITNLKGETGSKGETGAEGKAGTNGAEGPAGTSENADWKNSVRAATTANITIATALNPGDVLDGVTLAENDRVLVKNQTSSEFNGIYIVKAAPSRALDADSAGDLSGGVQVYVEQGTRNSKRVFTLTTVGLITIGTTAQAWENSTPKEFGLVSALPTTEALVNDRCVYKAVAGEVLWELVYDGAGEFPWKYLGGPPLRTRVNGAGERNNATFGDCTAGVTTVPSVTAPLKGDYGIEHGAQVLLTGGASSNCFVSVSIAGAAAAKEDGGKLVGIDQFEGGTVHSGYFVKTLAAANTVAQKYGAEVNTLTWLYEMRWISMIPLRVG